MHLLEAYFETVATQAVLFAMQDLHRDTKRSGLVELSVSLTEGGKKDTSTRSSTEVEKKDESIMEIQRVLKRNFHELPVMIVELILCSMRVFYSTRIPIEPVY